MATHQILFTRKNNENSTTALDPVAPWCGQVDLETTGSFCVSFDFDMLIECKLYEVRAIELPDFLSAEEWCARNIEWRYVWGAGVEMTWPEAWQRGLMALSFGDRYAACKLLCVKKFRSEFRKSLRDQIVAWLEAPASERRYGNPLSPRQWDAIAVRPYEAKRAQEAIYRAR